jgi:diguanylate cyclase (GGDEF)-like protein
MVFDLDRFKLINDRCGHAAGDGVLQLFSAVMRKAMRADDVLGRLGGEEFVALVPGTLGEGARVAERVRQAFAAARLVRNGLEIATTVSAGVACGAPTAPLELLIASADAALYRAKAGGRDRVELSDEAVAGLAAGAAAPSPRRAMAGAFR